MRSMIVALILLAVASSSCRGPARPSSSPPAPETGTPAPQQVLPSATASSAPASRTPTRGPDRPTPMPPPPISAEAFGLAQPLHEYWPVVRDAAGLHESILFGTSVTALAYSPDGRYLAVGGCDAPAASGYVYSPPSTTLCEYASFDMLANGYLYILDAEKESLIATMPETGQAATFTQAAFSPDGNSLVYALSTGRIAIWDIPSGRVQAVISEGVDSMQSALVTISPDNKWIVVANSIQSRIWDVAQGQFVRDIPRGWASQFSADGHRLLFADYPYLAVYDTGAWEQLSVRILMPDGVDNLYAVSPDLSLLATCDRRLTDKPRPMNLWDIETGELIHSLNYKFSRCGRLAFSPDGRLLLRFDDHGVGPMIWRVDGWQFVSGSDFKTAFVGDKDLYVNSMQFAQDGRSVLVDTVQRLTLYSLPAAETASAPATLPPDATARPVAPTLTVKPQSCNMTVTGWLKLELQPCLPPSRGVAGSLDSEGQLIDLRDGTASGVVIYIPSYLQTRLKPGTYPIADFTAAGANMTASFAYNDAKLNLIDGYFSYDNGTLTLTQAGLDEDFISGSFSFGAHNFDGLQINVEGTFENIPFSHVNGP